ncbi:peroxisome biogenesis factor 10 isoform X2 [Pseudomyrmex gracilis]|uniref:peroxisome biogenesis factor 10 isoform X2 n=1 Tax=Pseudomyrmex gracilis TaxID=219809 RepID=UPI0009949240|nr:peroxisome biogenesis factor 10 isoform X2 [Pseudomyrmex gracilis]
MGIMKEWSRRKLKCASQAEILRSHQRDDNFVKYLKKKMYEKILQNYELVYFTFTSGLGNQTLGEEYTGIVQTNLEKHKVPTLMVRIFGAILEYLGEEILLTLVEQCQAHVNHSHNNLTSTAITFLNLFLSKLHIMTPIIILFHKGIFYINGRYYSLGRRITRLDYSKVYGYQSVNAISWGFRLLGIATLIQCLLRIWQTNMIQDNTIASISNEKSNNQNCRLCFEATATTATICGHLFCWKCLSEWLRVKPQCPFCRDYVSLSRIVHMTNL